MKHGVSVKCVKRSLTGVRAFVQHHRMHHPRVNIPNAGVSGFLQKRKTQGSDCRCALIPRWHPAPTNTSFLRNLRSGSVPLGEKKCNPELAGFRLNWGGSLSVYLSHGLIRNKIHQGH